MSNAGARIPGAGRIDRNTRLAFTFDGRVLEGLAGDTLASALLANGVRLVGRSFKLHRPRGIYSAGVEEPNALVALRTGARAEPNVQATMAELWDGLAAESQNRWPSLAFDVMAVNGALARFMPAGFYYKTFMGPTRGSWMFYEPWIRRAAGLGRAARAPDPDRYERESAWCDVLVVGAGPAGLAAAIAAARSGVRVILAEQHATAGGQLLSERADSPAEQWRRACIDELESSANVRIMTRTTTFGAYDGNVFGALERVWDHVAAPPAGQPRQRAWTIHPGRVVLATGATERPLLFVNNDRPGVMLAEAARRYVNHFGVRPGNRVVVCTNNDSAYAAALDLDDAGAEVTVVDTRPAPGNDLLEAMRAAGIEVRRGARVVAARGRGQVSSVHVAATAGADDLDCDLLCVSGGWSPNVHLASHLGARPVYRADIGAFVPGTLPAAQSAAGALAGAFDADSAATEGWRAGLSAASADVGAPPPDGPTTAASPGYVQPEDGPSPRRRARGKIFVDIQNDVTADDVELAWREGYRSVEHLKRYTTLGMGTDQGRTSNINGLTLMAALRGDDIPNTGVTTFRPPFTPVSFGALAGGHVGPHFRAERRTPMHDWHAANGVEFMRAGAWLRPWYYRTHGEDADTAGIHEMRQVRGNVGMVDVSTLGKIDVQGPDAAEFLNRVYVNAWLKLPVGKARYGVMLRDDGIALDDGTTSRIGEHQYFMTTTTGEAAVVMSWLEFLLETAWTDLRVQVTSVTDQWAGVAVAGPNSRRVLVDALPGADLDDETLPPMGVRDAECDDGLPVRVLRVSFSGERAYEVYTPAGYGRDLWERIMDAGRPHGIEPYGVEALGALRIEKGHPIASELDGRTTLDDLGLGRMARTSKPFVGDVLRQRPALTAAGRRAFVGLKPVDASARLRAGSLLFSEGDAVDGHGIGHVTSAAYSPTLGTHIALAFLEGGREREGEIVRAVSPIHGEDVRVHVVAPVFLDPEGERIHA